MTFKDLKGYLILLSYDTVRPEDESQTWHNVLPYTFEDGCLLRYELDGDDDIDHTIDLDNYAVAQRTPFDMDEFEKVNDLLIRILLTEGKEIIRKAPKKPSEPEHERIYTSEELSNIGESLVWLNDLFEDDGNILMPALKSLKRSNRRMARKSFFHNMFGF